jgi:hypothetical protein
LLIAREPGLRRNCGIDSNAVNSLHRGLIGHGELIEEKRKFVRLLGDALGK